MMSMMMKEPTSTNGGGLEAMTVESSLERRTRTKSFAATSSSNNSSTPMAAATAAVVSVAKSAALFCSLHKKRQTTSACMMAVLVVLVSFVLMGLWWKSTNTDSSAVAVMRAPPSSSSDSPSSLKVAWLMSFPNSGTSYTSKMIRHASRLSTASNYGEENRDQNGNSVPVYPNTTNGPFWIDPHSQDVIERPTNYALTKTVEYIHVTLQISLSVCLLTHSLSLWILQHCGGRCEKCGPSRYVENPHSFLVQCLSGRRGFTNDVGVRVFEEVTYPLSLVHKAVHLVRNPFDNVVSRFHLEHHAFWKRNDTAKLRSYPSTREGFRAFCHDRLDGRFAREEASSRLVDPRVHARMKDIPCHADFFRFVQWHNLAFVTTNDMDIPTHVLLYERYETHFEETAHNLLDFLELDFKGDLINFIKGKEYKEYFDASERRIVRDAMKELALRVTWKHLKHYFDDIDEEDDDDAA